MDVRVAARSWEVVRRIYDDYVNGGFSVRQIARRLFSDGVPTPFGRKPVWHESTLSRILRNAAYIGTLYYNVHETTKRPTRTGKQGHTERLRPEEEWIPIRIPAILADDVFEAAQRVARDNSRFSPRHLKNEAWLLRSLVICGTCGSVLGSVQYPGRRQPMRYYRCPKMGQNLERALTNCRCPQRQVRADELDAFVFGELRAALLQPEVLLAGQTALAERAPSPDDELLDAQLRHLDRKLEQADAERRRLVDLYQAGLLELVDLQRRAKDVEARRRHLADQRGALVAQRQDLARDNQVRQRVADFARQVSQGLDAMDFEHRQRLVRLLVEEVRIVGWKVEMRLRIPLDEGPHPAPPSGRAEGELAVSTNERLRSSPQDGGLVTTH